MPYFNPFYISCRFFSHQHFTFFVLCCRIFIHFYQYFSYQSPISNFLLLRRGSFFRQCTVLLCSQLFCREYLSDFYFRLAQIKEFVVEVFLLHFLNEFGIFQKLCFVIKGRKAKLKFIAYTFLSNVPLFKNCLLVLM